MNEMKLIVGIKTNADRACPEISGSHDDVRLFFDERSETCQRAQLLDNVEENIEKMKIMDDRIFIATIKTSNS